MADILIRDVPDEVVSALDARAKRQGLSRTEFLRRTLTREATPRGKVTREDLLRFSEMASDLADDEIMRRAWE